MATSWPGWIALCFASGEADGLLEVWRFGHVKNGRFCSHLFYCNKKARVDSNILWLTLKKKWFVGMFLIMIPVIQGFLYYKRLKLKGWIQLMLQLFFYWVKGWEVVFGSTTRNRTCKILTISIELNLLVWKGGLGWRKNYPIIWWSVIARPETNSEFTPESRPGPKRDLVFQPSIFRSYVSFREVHKLLIGSPPNLQEGPVGPNFAHWYCLGCALGVCCNFIGLMFVFPAFFLQKKGAEMTELSGLGWVGSHAVQHRSTGPLDQKSVSFSRVLDLDEKNLQLVENQALIRVDWKKSCTVGVYNHVNNWIFTMSTDSGCININSM